MALKQVRRESALEDELRRLRESLKTSFFTVNHRPTPIEEFEGVTPALSACHGELVSEARALGWDAAVDLCPPGMMFISRGIERGGISGDLVDYTRNVGPAWSASAVHLSHQERSPKIILTREGDGGHPIIAVRKMKGGGVRERTHGSSIGMDSELVVSKPDVFLPFYVSGKLIRRVDVPDGDHKVWKMRVTRFQTRSIWGACMRDDAREEFVRMLGMHHLMRSIDGGRRAGVLIPLGVSELTEVPIVDGGVERSIAVEDYFTNPDYLSVKDLFLIAYEARARARERGLSEEEMGVMDRYVQALEGNDSYYARRRDYDSSRFTTTLSEEERAGIEGSRFFEPAVKETLGDLRLKAGRVINKVIGLAQIQTLGGDDVRINQLLERVLYEAMTKGEIDVVLKLIYANYGENLVLPQEGPRIPDVIRRDQVQRVLDEEYDDLMAYLRRVYELNRGGADGILRRFAYNFFRDIGALHGTGGYFGGYQGGMPRGERAEEFGAPTGGSTELRNTDLLGNKHDLDDDVFIPFLGLHKKAPNAETVREMQLKDLFLAEVTFGKMNTLLTGKAENETAFNLDVDRGAIYMQLGFRRGEGGRVARLEGSLRDLREGAGVKGGYSEHWRSLQAYRDHVYGDFFERGRRFTQS